MAPSHPALRGGLFAREAQREATNRIKASPKNVGGGARSEYSRINGTQKNLRDHITGCKLKRYKVVRFSHFSMGIPGNTIKVHCLGA